MGGVLSELEQTVIELRSWVQNASDTEFNTRLDIATGLFKRFLIHPPTATHQFIFDAKECYGIHTIS